jgi:assimilatory nitrate reductase catalytic subunit
MHWGPEWLSGGVNRLTLPVTDPVSRQPELKHAAVSLERAELAHRLLAVGWVDAGRLIHAQRLLRASFEGVAFGSCVPFGRDACGLVLRLAGATPFDAGLPERIAAAFGHSPSTLLRYEDRRRHRLRWLAVDAARLSFALSASDGGEAEEREARRLHTRVVERTPLRSVAALLGPDDGGDADTPRARTVCSCVGTTDRQILAYVERTGERRLDAVQAALSCGSGCGSCRAEVTRLIEAAPAATSRIA